MDFSYIIDLLMQLRPVVYFIITILITWIITRLVGSVIQRIMRYSPYLLAAHVRRLVIIMIWLFGVVVATEQLGLGIEILVSLVIIAGVGMIIALRDVLANIAAKYFSDIYVPFKRGDLLSVGGYKGTVIEVNPMVTVLLSNDGKLISIPNSILIREVVINETQEAWSEILIPILVDVNVDLAEFESELLKRINKLRPRLDERFPPIITTRRRDGGTVEILLTLRIKDPSVREEVVAEINRRVSEVMVHLKSR